MLVKSVLTQSTRLQLSFFFYIFKFKQKDTNIQPCIRKHIPDLLGQQRKELVWFVQSHTLVFHICISLLLHANLANPKFLVFIFILKLNLCPFFHPEYFIALKVTEAMQNSVSCTLPSFVIAPSLHQNQSRVNPRNKLLLSCGTDWMYLKSWKESNLLICAPKPTKVKKNNNQQSSVN